MLEILGRHPYLTLSLFLLVACLLGLWLAPHHRRPALMSAALSAPTAGFALIYVPAYWQPELIVALPIGVEDLMFSFANGGLVWLMISRGNTSLQVRIDGSLIARRWLIMAAIFMPLLAGALWAGLPVMHAVLLCAAAAGAGLLWRRPSNVRLAAKGAMVYGAFYAAVLWVSLQLWPRFLEQWNAQALTGVLILGIPAEEIAWAMAFGAVWPLFVAYLFDPEPATTTVST